MAAPGTTGPAPGSAGPLNQADIDKLEQELDSEVRFRPLGRIAEIIVAGLLLALSIFHYYTAGFGLLPETTHRGIHIAFVLGLIFLVFPARTSTTSFAGLSSLGRKQAITAAVLVGLLYLSPISVRDFSLMTREHWWLVGAAIVLLGGSYLTSHGGKPDASPIAPFGISLFDWVLMAGAVASSLYVPWVFHDLQFRVGNPLTIDWVMGTIMVVVLLEACRRSVGWPLPIIAIVLILYALYGRSMPGILQHPGNQWKGVVNHLYLTSQSIFGVALGVVATFVFHYVLFGVLATRMGLGRFFIDLATALTGRFSGGPAKVSIFGSGLFGMISGSSIANTVTVGSLTIPAMIRIGYPRHFAGAVESTAATGGQITPPIMGAAAFLMVEYLNMPYQSIVLAAIVPAAMHFFGVFCQVHFEAKKHGLKGLPPEELPRAGEVIRRDWPTSIPLLVLLMVLFSGFTPYLAAFWGITACILIWLTGRDPLIAVGLLVLVGVEIALDLLTGWPGIAVLFALILAAIAMKLSKAPDAKRQLLELADAFVVGAKYAISVGAAAATVGIIIGVVTLTGVGFKLSNIVTSTAAELASFFATLLPASLADVKGMTLFFTLVMTAIVCILLGCGVPTTANYLIMVTIAAPALAMLGVPQLVSHFFVFYYGVLADITPPVALAAYAGASMAGADPFKTGNTAFRLGLAKALVPFVFVYSPSMLLVVKGFTWAAFWETTIGCMVGIVMLAAALTGYGLARLTRLEQVWLAIASVLVITPSRTATFVGLAMAAPILVRQIMAWRSGAAQAASSAAGTSV